MTKDDQTVSEKWYDRIRVIAPPGLDRLELTSRLSFPIPEPLGITELQMTEKEATLVKRILYALNVFMTTIGLEPVRISPNRLHLVTETHLKEHTKCEAGGFNYFGHAYVATTGNPADFVQAVSHELTHMAAFNSIKVICRMEEKGWGCAVCPDRSGIAVWRPVSGQDKDDVMRFAGLNEAVTEVVSQNVRAIMCEGDRLLSSDDHRRLTTSYSYWPHVKIITELVGLLTGDSVEPMPEGKVLSLLLQDYFRGTFNFVRAVERRLTGAARVLYETGSRNRDALVAAELLDLHDAAAIIAEVT